MTEQKNKLFLYSGLSILFISLVAKYFGLPSLHFWVLFGIAIFLKLIFLVNIFHIKGVKMGLGLYFIIAGVIVIMISLLFKYVYPIPLLRDILFYTAIGLKLSGLGIMIFKKNA